MNYREIMTDAAQIVNDRHAAYGEMRTIMERTAQIASLTTGIRLTAHDVALILHAMKLSRMGSNRKNKENYVDGLNYLAFAGELAMDTVYDELPLTSTEEAMIKEFSEFAAKVQPEMSEKVEA